MVPEDSRPARAAHLGQLGSNRGNSREESTRNLLSYKTMMKHSRLKRPIFGKPVYPDNIFGGVDYHLSLDEN